MIDYSLSKVNRFFVVPQTDMIVSASFCGLHLRLYMLKELKKRIKRCVKQILKEGLDRTLSQVREDVSRLLDIDCKRGLAKALCEQAIFKRLSKARTLTVHRSKTSDLLVFSRS